ncbi:MAG: membrane dipeptidase [Gammaproteobacteria bacterium]|nr:membrane dipeptidase [Gammaproteobacteria bacterium]
MHRVPILLVAAAALSACTDRENAATPSTDAGSDGLHAATLTLDTHVDIDLDFATETINPLDADIQVNLEKMREGGLDTAFFVVYVGQTERTPENYARVQADAMTKFEAIHRMTSTLYPDLIGLAYRADDVERLVNEGKLVAAIGVENGFSIGTDLELIDRYYELGARYLGLVHNGHNDLADSASPRPRFGDNEVEHDGVSELGAAAIRRMNELGIMVDISHGSKQTALDAIALSEAPVIASHSSVHALGDHVRNLDDETLLSLRDNGGVVQVVAFDIYINVRPPEFFEARSALRESLGLRGFVDPRQLDEDIREAYERGMAEIDSRWTPANVAAFVDHIDYVVDLIGIDHVGISSDFGGGGGISGWADAAETPNVTAELIARGYSAEDIGKIWGGNLLRVWREVEAVADRL